MLGQRFHHLSVIALSSVLLLASSVRAQEWTRFRGPNGTGISSATTVPVECTEANRNWKTDLPGTGHSSPVVWGDHVFVTSAEEDAGKRYLLCIRSTDGRVLWKHTYDFSKYPHHQFNSSASSTAAVDKDHVYISWCSPDGLTVYALTHDGKDVWSRDLGKWNGQHGGGCSPVVVDDLVVMRSDSDEMGPDSFITGLDAKTGAVRWKTPRTSKTASYSTPILYEPKGGAPQLIFTSNGHGITSIDPKTGSVNWEVGGLFQQRCVSGPVLVNGLLFGTAGDGGGRRQAVAIRPGAKGVNGGGEIAYQLTRVAPYVPTPIVLGDRMFLWGDSGIVTCVQAATGEVVWTERVGGNFFGSPVCVNGKIYALSAKGELVVVEASDQFKILGRSDLGEASHSTPAVAGGAMFVRTESHLISFGGKKP
jgi:outer membrane protein assembly factor BamB